MLVHDFLLSKRGIALPATHGLRNSIERHKARLNSELTRARIRRKAGSTDVLRQQIETEYLGEAAQYPRWVRVNALKTTLEDQLDSTFKDFARVYSVGEVTAAAPGKPCYYVDEHIPNLLAVSPTFEFAKTEAYTAGAIILQDKASCFPAYLLDPLPEDGDVIDSCAAPGNKTTHLAALLHTRATAAAAEEEALSGLGPGLGSPRAPQKIYAFEKDRHRARTLDKMVGLAGAKDTVRINFAQDFLRADPRSDLFKDVGALLLDPSCSGSGIVGRDAPPTLHLPETPVVGSVKKGAAAGKPDSNGRKRKRGDGGGDNGNADSTAGGDSNKQGKGREKKSEPPREEVLFMDDDGAETTVASERELRARLEALSAFQLTLLLHALAFPAARKITYSTCSVHAEENERVVLRALRSDVARRRGWCVLRRHEQVRGLREWPVRGRRDACRDDVDGDDEEGDEEVAESCIRSYKDDGRGVMGFFVAAFVRDVAPSRDGDGDDDGPYVRDEDGRIVRDMLGMPTLKDTHQRSGSRPSVTGAVVPAPLDVGGTEERTTDGSELDDANSGADSSEADEDEDEDEWNGFD